MLLVLVWYVCQDASLAMNSAAEVAVLSTILLNWICVTILALDLTQPTTAFNFKSYLRTRRKGEDRASGERSVQLSGNLVY